MAEQRRVPSTVGRRVGRIGVGRTVGILGNLGRTVHQTIVDVYSSVLCSSREEIYIRGPNPTVGDCSVKICCQEIPNELA